MPEKQPKKPTHPKGEQREVSHVLRLEPRSAKAFTRAAKKAQVAAAKLLDAVAAFDAAREAFAAAMEEPSLLPAKHVAKRRHLSARRVPAITHERD